MGEIFVVVEHRKDAVREITHQMLWKANDLSQKLSKRLIAVLIGAKNDPLVHDLKKRADSVILVENDRFKAFDGDLYKEILYGLIQEHQPYIMLIGHTPWGMDLAPSLAIKTGFPVATDCVDILVEDGPPKAVRQIYNGKLFSKVSLKESKTYLFTVRCGAFPPRQICTCSSFL